MHAAGVDEGVALTGVVLGAQDDAGGVAQRFAQVLRADIADKLLRDHLDRHRDVLDRGVEPRTGDGIGGTVALVLFGVNLEGRELHRFIGSQGGGLFGSVRGRRVGCLGGQLGGEQGQTKRGQTQGAGPSQGGSSHREGNAGRRYRGRG